VVLFCGHEASHSAPRGIGMVEMTCVDDVSAGTCSGAGGRRRRGGYCWRRSSTPKGHLSAEELADVVQAQVPDVHISTIYGTSMTFRVSG